MRALPMLPERVNMVAGDRNDRFSEVVLPFLADLDDSPLITLIRKSDKASAYRSLN